MKLLKLIGIRTGIIALALFLGLSVGIPAFLDGNQSKPFKEAVFTIGIAGVAYAATPDYIVDGVDDNIQAQLAIDALPSTGGKVIFFGGNYSFSATVTRAINNVTIEGSGKSTYFAHDGATAIFSAGAQTGWEFKNIRTDAGWITAASDTVFTLCMNGTSVVDSTVPSGTTMPTYAVVGQQFYQNTTGRDVLYTYNGSSWQPMESFGPMTVYVDLTDGTDDQNHGTGVDANAFKTLQYAINAIPLIIGGTATININSETYTEDILIWRRRCITTTDPFGIIIQGTLSATASGNTATGGTQGGGANLPTVTDAGLVNHAWNNKLIKFTSGANNGLYRIVDHNDVGTITTCGDLLTGAPGAGDTYDIYDWGTTIAGYVDIHPGNGVWIEINDIKVTGFTSQNYGLVVCESTVYCNRVFVNNNLNGFVATTFSYMELHQCLGISNSAGWNYTVLAEYMSQIPPIDGCKFLGNGGNSTGILVDQLSWILLNSGTVVDGFGVGLLSQKQSLADCITWGCNSVIRNNTTYGAQANIGAEIYNTSSITYTANGTNENATAANYSYID